VNEQKVSPRIQSDKVIAGSRDGRKRMLEPQAATGSLTPGFHWLKLPSA
jgi:hypothetical protein